MALKRYQLTRFGTGFKGRPFFGLPRLSRRLRRVLKRFTTGELRVRVELRDGKVNEYEHLSLAQAVQRNAHALGIHGIGVRVITGSYNYDEPRFSTRSVAWNPPPPPEHPFITYGKTFIGHSSYSLGASGPPGSSDCSSFTRNVVKEVAGVDLIHQADAQMRQAEVRTFVDPAELQSGDLIFYHYPNSRGLRWDQATHVEFYDHGGTALGSRPSTNGVSWYRLSSFDWDAILCYGRVG